MGRALAAVGDVLDANTFSGIPYYLWEAGKPSGFLEIPARLNPSRLRVLRCRWQVTQLARGRRPRGFQYTNIFRTKLCQQFEKQIDTSSVSEVLSHNPIFPAVTWAREHGIPYSFYIDAPLADLFEMDRMREWLDVETADAAVLAERNAFIGARRIIAMSTWVAESLGRNYGIPSHKIHVVRPGANLSEPAVSKWLFQHGPRVIPAKFTMERPFRIGFTGKDWRRKGLPRLVKAAELLKKRGYPVEVWVAGFIPKEFAKHAIVRWKGFIDKTVDTEKFLDTIGSYDLGCFPSYEEPFGIAPLECLRLGIPILCTETGGLAETCPVTEGAGIMVGRDVTGEEIAETIQPLIHEPARLQQMADATWAIRERYTWSEAVERLRRIWN